MMNQILYFKGKIQFNKEQAQTLFEDNYILFFKSNTISIHTNSQITPIYSSIVDKIIWEQDKIIICSKKQGDIEVLITNIYSKIDTSGLSKRKLTRTREKNYKEYIIQELPKYNYQIIASEYQTNTGRIDLIVSKEGVVYLVELKNKAIVEKDITQCLRYLEDLQFTNYKGIVIGPSYSEKVKEYAKRKQINLLIYEQLGKQLEI